MINIYIVSHKNLKMPNVDGYVPIQVGPSSYKFQGYIRDNTQDNIANKNPNYCELTAQYWIWKNDNSNIKGLVHYRRFFTKNKFHFNKYQKLSNILNKKEIHNYLRDYDLILPKKRKYYIETSYSHYIHAHKKIGLDKTRKIIKQYYPNYLNNFDMCMNKRSAHMFNMLIAKSNVFNNYSEWLFSVLNKLEKNLNISSWSKNESRIYGYVSELLLDVWISKHKYIKYKEMPVSFIGKQHWIKKGSNFIIRKFAKK